MGITFKINEELNGIEIQFSEKPSAEVLAKLKALGFRWSPYKSVWYAKQTEERLAFARSIEKADVYEQISLFTPKAEDKPQDKAEPKKAQADKPKKAPTKTTKTDKPTKISEPKAESKAKAEPKKDNIIEFAKERPNVKVRMAFDEQATIEECIDKANKEKAIYKDSDSTFVLNGLVEMCKVNPNFRNNFMQTSKTYEGAFKYFMNLARQGFAHTFNGVAYMDNNLALGFAIDYYNMIEE